MRIAHFIHRYPPAVGGSETYFARLSEWLAAHGDQVSVFTTNADELSAFWDRSARRLAAGVELRNGVKVRRCALWHFPVAHRYVMKALSLLPFSGWQALTVPFNPVTPAMWSVRERFDLVHAGAFPYSFPLVCARRLAHRLRVPFFLTPFVHTGDPDDGADPIRRAYTTPALLDLARSADRVFVQTEGERQALAERGVNEARLVLQGLGVDEGGCTGGDRAAFGVTGAVVVGHLANHSREKGTIDLLEAAQQAWDAGANLHLLLAGPQMPAFRAYWKDFRPRGPVRLLGVLDDRQKQDFFAALDVFALPSRSDSFGLVLPEAWANSVPCVVYRAGGPPWIVRHELDGLVVRCGDISGLAAALCRLAGDPEMRREMGQAGRARLHEFDWDAKLRIVANEYQAIGGSK